jgi:hypothetical protein
VRININEKDKKEIATIYKVQYSECQKQWRDRELMIQAKIKNRLFFFSKDGIGGKGNIEPVLINLKGSYFVFLFWLFSFSPKIMKYYLADHMKTSISYPLKAICPVPLDIQLIVLHVLVLFMLKRSMYLTVHTSPRYANFEFVCDMPMPLINFAIKCQFIQMFDRCLSLGDHVRVSQRHSEIGFLVLKKYFIL